MLTDTGPLVALLDTDDFCHSACLATLARLPKGPLETTWPCFTEAMYLLSRVGGIYYQNALWNLVDSNRLVVLDFSALDIKRMSILMNQYQNVPMDFADASLVAIAESRNFQAIFTIDSDFYIYRLANGSTLEIFSGKSQ